jgi:hypothetical protein
VWEERTGDVWRLPCYVPARRIDMEGGNGSTVEVDSRTVVVTSRTFPYDAVRKLWDTPARADKVVRRATNRKRCHSPVAMVDSRAEGQNVRLKRTSGNNMKERGMCCEVTS